MRRDGPGVQRRACSPWPGGFRGWSSGSPRSPGASRRWPPAATTAGKPECRWTSQGDTARWPGEATGEAPAGRAPPPHAVVRADLRAGGAGVSGSPSSQQLDEMDCGVACLSMIARWHGSDVSVSWLREVAATGPAGTSLRGLASSRSKIGLDVQPFKVSDDGVATSTCRASSTGTPSTGSCSASGRGKPRSPIPP